LYEITNTWKKSLQGKGLPTSGIIWEKKKIEGVQKRGQRMFVTNQRMSHEKSPREKTEGETKRERSNPERGRGSLMVFAPDFNRKAAT